MSYRKERLTQMGPFPIGYRDTAFSSSTPNDLIPFTHTVDSRYVSITGGYAISGGPVKIYSVGETRAAYPDGETGLQTVDLAIANSYGSTSKGYQVRDNAPGSYLCDDACYGLNTHSQLTLKVGNISTSSNMYSSAHETRMMGIVTK